MYESINFLIIFISIINIIITIHRRPDLPTYIKYSFYIGEYKTHSREEIFLINKYI